jgi:DNA-binding winged helix-turn-helix (wHTH) protein/tetratricopeptide (TPR) repeat protein
MSVADRVELAHEPDFVLGRLTISPSRRELVRDDGEREVIEHRMMRVLIALSKARGNILTRDELIMCCWDGVVVGEDAINRVMSRLRKVANGIGAGSIEIETITKVGYRLTSNGEAAAQDYGLVARGREVAGMEPPRTTRRGLVTGAIGVATVAAAGGGAILYRRLRTPPISSEVQALVAQGLQLRDQNSREGQYQAIAVFRRITELAPSFADGWGRLGYAYAIPSHYRERTENQMLRAKAEEAARRALEIDPGNALGEIALAAALPLRGAWIERDRHLARARADRPNDPDVLAANGVVLQFTGQNREAASFYERMRKLPLTPAVYVNYLSALWSAGRVEALDRAMDEAASLYPTQASIWSIREDILKFSGRTDALSAMFGDPQTLPTGMKSPQLDEEMAVTRAIETRDPAIANSVMEKKLADARLASGPAEEAIRVAAGLSRLDDAFAVADAYYFSRGFTIPDLRGLRSSVYSVTEQRQTRLLFEPVTRSMRADPRFEPLVEELGLDRYWRESGAQPDYRRA